ncbi:MAG: hypothetical protein AB7N24_04765 [Dehalococcoidia bacterium]
MTEFQGEMPHEPAPPEPRQLLPAMPLLLRGLALAALMVTSLWFAIEALKKSVLLFPFSLIFALTGSLAGWAAAIYLTGGEKHADHPFI